MKEQIKLIKEKMERLERERDMELEILKSFELREIDETVKSAMENGYEVDGKDADERITERLKTLAIYTLQRENSIKEKYTKELGELKECLMLLIKIIDRA